MVISRLKRGRLTVEGWEKSQRCWMPALRKTASIEGCWLKALWPVSLPLAS